MLRGMCFVLVFSHQCTCLLLSKGAQRRYPRQGQERSLQCSLFHVNSPGRLVEQKWRSTVAHACGTERSIAVSPLFIIFFLYPIGPVDDLKRICVCASHDVDFGNRSHSFNVSMECQASLYKRSPAAEYPLRRLLWYFSFSCIYSLINEAVGFALNSSRRPERTITPLPMGWRPKCFTRLCTCS